jgi:hypothetical protein
VFHCKHCSNSRFVKCMFNCWVDFTKVLYLGMLTLLVEYWVWQYSCHAIVNQFKVCSRNGIPIVISTQYIDINLERTTYCPFCMELHNNTIDESVHYKWKNTGIMNRPVRKVGRKEKNTEFQCMTQNEWRGLLITRNIGESFAVRRWVIMSRPWSPCCVR